MNQGPIPSRSSRQLRLTAMPKRQVESFDPRERAAAKQAARDVDAQALRDGEISVAQLHRKNGLLAFPKEHLSVDFAGAVAPNR